MATIDTSLFPSATFKVDTGEDMPVTSRLNALRQSQMGDIAYRQAQMQERQAQQQEADNMLLRQAYNAPDPVNFLAQQGRGDLVPAVKESIYKTQEAESKLKTQNLAYDKANHERIDQLIGDVTRYTTADQANSALDSMLEKGEIDPQTHSMYRNIVVSTPWPQAKTQILGGLRSVQEQFESMQPQEPKFGTYQPGDYTTASWAKFTTSKNPADLQLKRTAAETKSAKEAEAVSDTGITTAERNKREAAYPKAKLSFTNASSDIDTLISDLNTLKSHKGLSGITGLVYGRTPGITGDARAAEALLEKILSRGQFRSLQELRNNSPTGGAVGNVSDFEGRALRSSFGALDRKQDTPDFQNAIDDVIDQLKSSKQNLTGAFEDTYAYRSGGTPSAPAAQTKVSGKGTKDDPIKLD